ncbi:MAG: DUF2000 domain-containing protein [Desulfovibrionaceae bacterium]|nr:DUF2000 domain-containing protein [Desulfovibrionaceae bacterium]
MLDPERDKCVLVIAEGLAPGLAANAAAVLATSVAARFAGVVGPDVLDAAGGAHPGITRHALPVLRSARAALPVLRDSALARGLFVATFTATAQRSRHYDDYELRMAGAAPGELDYLGLALAGGRVEVAALADGLRLL